MGIQDKLRKEVEKGLIDQATGILETIAKGLKLYAYEKRQIEDKDSTPIVNSNARSEVPTIPNPGSIESTPSVKKETEVPKV